MHQVPLPEGPLNLGPGVWAPDGKHIVFDGFSDGDSSVNGLYLGGLAGGRLTRLTTTRGVSHPVWTPDGRGIVFSGFL